MYENKLKKEKEVLNKKLQSFKKEKDTFQIQTNKFSKSVSKLQCEIEKIKLEKDLINSDKSVFYKLNSYIMSGNKINDNIHYLNNYLSMVNATSNIKPSGGVDNNNNNEKKKKEIIIEKPDKTHYSSNTNTRDNKHDIINIKHHKTLSQEKEKERDHSHSSIINNKSNNESTLSVNSDTKNINIIPNNSSKFYAHVAKINLNNNNKGKVVQRDRSYGKDKPKVYNIYLLLGSDYRY